MVRLGKVLEFKGVDHTVADEYPSYLIVLIMSIKNSVRHKGEKIYTPFFSLLFLGHRFLIYNYEFMLEISDHCRKHSWGCKRFF